MVLLANELTDALDFVFESAEIHETLEHLHHFLGTFVMLNEIAADSLEAGAHLLPEIPDIKLQPTHVFVRLVIPFS